MTPSDISIILPAKNEGENLRTLIPTLLEKFPEAEILIINDGSTDETVSVCETFPVRCVSHPYSMGNGAAVKTGARHATNEVLVFMDADGQHTPEGIQKLLNKMNEGFDMVVGARTYRSQANIGRGIANKLNNSLASWITGHKIQDLTSGFRAVRAKKFLDFLHLLPNGFSYPTTITMAFFRVGFSVAYVPIEAKKRSGKSHIKLLKDGTRFLLIIFRVGTLYSPLKIFFPISVTLFFTGLCYYGYTYFDQGRFTNMSALLLTSALTIFLIGLVSEQITYLIYSKSKQE